MQTRYWDFSEIDATEFMNDVIAALARRRQAGPGEQGGGPTNRVTHLRPGRLVGFQGVGGTGTISLKREGGIPQMAVTKDGVIVVEDADLSNVVTFSNVASANPRIDLVALKHSYSASLPNTAAQYIVITGIDAVKPVANYANLSLDETIIAEVWIDPTPGIGNPPVIADSDIRLLPSVFDLLVSDHEPTFGRSDNSFGDAGVWARMGRNDDRFYVMRDPEDSRNVFLVLNAYYEPGDVQRVTGNDGSATASGSTMQSLLTDFPAVGVKPGDTLDILTGANVGSYSITIVVGDTLTVTPVFPATDSAMQFKVTSNGGQWYQEDGAYRSFLAALSDSDSASAEMFGIYKADDGAVGDTFGNFWSSILSSTEDGDLTWPLLFAGQNLVYGCQITWSTTAQIGVQAGQLYNNGKFRKNAAPLALDIANIYNAGTMTWGRRSGEAISTNWWYVYATTDITGNGFGAAISTTKPDELTLQHPSDADWRWIGSVYYDVDHWRRFFKSPDGYTSWSDDLGVATLIIANSTTPQPVTLTYEAPRTSALANFKIQVYPGDGGAVAVYFGHYKFTPEEVQIITSTTHSDHDLSYSSTIFPWSIDDQGRFRLRRWPGAGAYWNVVGYWEHVNMPLSFE